MRLNISNSFLDEKIFWGGFTATCVTVLCASFFIEHVYDVTLCKLCYYQRYIWLGLFFVCAFFLITHERFSSFAAHWTKQLIGFFLFMLSAGVALYQVAVEKEWITSKLCHLGYQKGMSFQEYMDMIKTQLTTDCSVINFEILGFSLAQINFALSLTLLIVLGIRSYVYIYNKARK